jgi:hypothetical protein
MKHLTPADYTVLIKNLPRGLDADYKKEIEDIMKFKATSKELNIKKVVLVYDIEYIEELEIKLDKSVKRK